MIDTIPLSQDYFNDSCRRNQLRYNLVNENFKFPYLLR